MRKLKLLAAALLLSTAQIVGQAEASAPTISAAIVRPQISAAADWVVPATIPPAPAAAEGASTIDLLSDMQLRFTRDGDSTYYEAAYRIASSEGLADAGLQLSWDPSLETLVVHKYHVIRDGKVIDLLGDGSKLAVIQRETNLESAALDGRLTATMQPDDVRVGDVIDFSYTRTRRDPALGGRSEMLVGPRDGNPYGRYRLRMVWPADKKLRWRASPGVLQPRLSQSPTGNELLVDLTDVTPPRPPRGAPARYMTVNAIDVSEFPDWASVAKSILPFYESARNLAPASPVRAEANRIAATTADPRRRAEMALALVQEQVRYLYLGMGGGGYVPASADLTWSRRFGDCKAKTVLLVALLRELGIDARPAFVNTESGDAVRDRMPAMGAFDHVIVQAVIGGRTYWLDGTQTGDTKLDRLRTPPYHVALPIDGNAKGLVPLNPEPLVVPSETISLSLDASAGIDAPAIAKGEMRFRGDSAHDMRAKYAGLSAADRDTELRKFWRKNYDFVTPTSVSAAVEDSTGDYVLRVNGTAKMDWFADAGARWYELDRARLGWKLDVDREPGINNDAPFAIDFPDFWESKETIKLPHGGAGFKLQGESIDRTIGDIYTFHRRVGIEDGVLTMEASTKALASELPASKAERTRTELAALSTGVFVRVPNDYLPTDADIAALQQDKPSLAKALLMRGALLLDQNKLAQSLADEDAVLAIDPSNATAHSVRALALALQDDAKADQAADRALALDPKQGLAWRAKGILALRQKRYADAEIALSEHLEIAGKDAHSLSGRASARILLGKFAAALADVDAALALDPQLNIRVLRASALAALDRGAEALVEADRAVDAEPQSETVRKARAELRIQLGDRPGAMEDYTALIAQAPSAELHLSRAALWSKVDRARRSADIHSALRMDSRSVQALAARASAAIDDRNFAAAERDISSIEKLEPNSRLVNALRSEWLKKQGRRREALQLVDAYIALHPKDAMALNERCWTKATLNLDIETAVADCDASLKLAPDSPATLDSRAFAQLKLGKVEAAIGDYDAALKLAPRLPASLYGRAIARARKGDAAGAQSDIAEARKLSPDIDERFAEFGISLPPSLGGSESADRGQRP